MVNIWYAGVLLLAFVASSGNAEFCSVTINADTCPSMETPFSISKQSPPPSATSQFETVTNEDGNEIDQLTSDSSKTTPFIPRPDSLTKQQRRITEVIERSRADVGESFVPSITDTRWKVPPQEDMNGKAIFAHYGLQSISTPATGNCQYYAVAMSLLDMRFDTPQHVETLEQMTQCLKEGIAEASRHGYEVEFPHDTRQAILVNTQLDTEGKELTIPESEEESDLLFQEYISEIAQSPSAVSAYLPTELWGTEVTLRMMAKLLQQPIFVIIAPYGLQTTINYQIYKPERVNKFGYELNSAEDYYVASSAPAKWFAQLQRACNEFNSQANPPIVLLFSNFHYSKVQFVQSPAAKARTNESER